MADAGDLKASDDTQDLVNTSKKQHVQTPANIWKQGVENTDSLQRAEARVRRLKAAVAIDPTLGPTLKLAEALVESFYMGAGDPDAEGRIATLLTEVGVDVELLTDRRVG